MHWSFKHLQFFFFYWLKSWNCTWPVTGLHKKRSISLNDADWMKNTSGKWVIKRTEVKLSGKWRKGVYKYVGEVSAWLCHLTRKVMTSSKQMGKPGVLWIRLIFWDFTVLDIKILCSRFRGFAWGHFSNYYRPVVHCVVLCIYPGRVLYSDYKEWNMSFLNHQSWRSVMSGQHPNGLIRSRLVQSRSSV